MSNDHKDKDRPSFAGLTREEQLHFGNGVGPAWLPAWARYFITEIASWFFQDASWRHHDFGYVVGGDRFDRLRCDRKFFRAMCKDAISQPKYRILRIPIAFMIAAVLYLAVRIFGQFGSFKYRKRYATLDEIRATYCT